MQYDLLWWFWFTMFAGLALSSVQGICRKGTMEYRIVRVFALLAVASWCWLMVFGMGRTIWRIFE